MREELLRLNVLMPAVRKLVPVRFGNDFKLTSVELFSLDVLLKVCKLVVRKLDPVCDSNNCELTSAI